MHEGKSCGETQRARGIPVSRGLAAGNAAPPSSRRAHAVVTEDYVTVILDDLELLPNEKFLVEHGQETR
jgi:hypothetical protein